MFNPSTFHARVKGPQELILKNICNEAYRVNEESTFGLEETLRNLEI